MTFLRGQNKRPDMNILILADSVSVTSLHGKEIDEKLNNGDPIIKEYVL
jgi:hypothetical protein